MAKKSKEKSQEISYGYITQTEYIAMHDQDLKALKHVKKLEASYGDNLITFKRKGLTIKANKQEIIDQYLQNLNIK